MKINGKEIKADKFAYDGKRQIYILEDSEDIENASKNGFYILPMDMIIDAYRNGDYQRFIMNWKATKQYMRQGDYVAFEDDEMIVTIKSYH